MDLIVRFWDVEKDELVTRYVTSIFPEKCDAESLLNAIIAALNKFELSLSKIIQGKFKIVSNFSS
jgi:hypothetical protein